MSIESGEIVWQRLTVYLVGFTVSLNLSLVMAEIAQHRVDELARLT